MSVNHELNNGNINFGISVGVNPEVNAAGAEYDRNLEEATAREKLAGVIDAAEAPVSEPIPQQRERMTGAVILQLVGQRGRNLELTRSQMAAGDQREAA
jgi:predicted nucleic acid-binding Zn ribbon protein